MKKIALMVLMVASTEAVQAGDHSMRGMVFVEGPAIAAVQRNRRDSGENAWHIEISVDPQRLEVGGCAKLVISIEGRIGRVLMKPIFLPGGLVSIANNSSTNVSLFNDRMTQSKRFEYLLLAKQPGTFRLGPFQLVVDGHVIATDPIEIVVNRPAVPPQLDDRPSIAI